jgi:hypothetical protein
MILKNKNMEVLKYIKGFDNYQVSNLGNVRSEKGKEFRLLKKGLNNAGYEMLTLYRLKKSTKQIHQLVAIAFLNHEPCKHNIVVNHKDFNKLNNSVDNLELISQRDNADQKHLKSKSNYTGVFFRKDRNKWKAIIHFEGRNKYLGLYNTEIEASKAYEEALKKIKE